jgi:ATP-dependent helicase HrpB
LGGRSDDIEQRLSGWGRERSQRAEAARKLAQRWAKAVGATESSIDIESAGDVLALGYPDRVARRRGNAFLMANGRAVAPPPDSPLARCDWIVVADASGSAAGARLLLGAPLHGDVEKTLATRIESRAVCAYDPATTGVTAETQRRLGAIMLARQPVERPEAARVRSVLLDAVAERGLDLLLWGESATSLRARLAFAAAHGLDLPASDDAALLVSCGEWLAPLLGRRLSDVQDAQLAEALLNRLDWNLRQRLDQFAPSRFTTPAGSSHTIDYAADGGPAVDMRVQSLFGLAHHPMVADGRVPLTLRLTSPAGRPIQVTKDLPGFWAGSWAEVRKDLRGRYPKHPWPDNPLDAPPTLRAKRPGQAG